MLHDLVDAWSALYANHAALRTAVEFMHVGGLLVGGGCAVAADLATLTAHRDPEAARDAELRLLKRTHRLVVVGLVALVMSGLLLFGADVDTYWYSRIYWFKMALVLLLLGNGIWLLVGEQRARGGDLRAWTHLHYAATSSLILWLLTTLVGAALPNIG